MKINFEVGTEEMIKFLDFLETYAASERSRYESTAKVEQVKKDSETRKEFLMAAIKEGMKQT